MKNNTVNTVSIKTSGFSIELNGKEVATTSASEVTFNVETFAELAQVMGIASGHVAKAINKEFSKAKKVS